MLPETGSILNCVRLFPQTTEGIVKLAEKAITDATASLKTILGTTDSNWSSVIRARDNTITAFSVTREILGMVKETAVKKEVRSEASRKYLELEQFFNTNFRYNKALYEKFMQCAEANTAEYASQPERAYYVKESREAFAHLGLNAPADKFAQIQAINERIQVKSTDFDNAISADNTKLSFAIEELKGMPTDVINGLPKDSSDGAKVLVGLDYPTYFAVQRACEVSETRAKLAEAFENRAFPHNKEVLRDMLLERQTFADALSFQSYAEWDLFRNMVRTPQTVSGFLSKAVEPLQRKWRAELRILSENLPESVKPLADGRFRQSDLQFMMHQYKAKHLSVDENKIREYFPVDHTIPAMFDVLSEFFNVDFLRADFADFWAEDVFAMTLVCRSQNKLLGHIIFDLYPRDGKYGHACCGSMIPSEQRDGAQSPALAIVLANFPRKTADSPGLLLHSDVETLFHEIGHAMHAVYGRCEMSSAAAYNVKMDFIEVPSQVIEEWAWEKDVLRRISKHYETKAVLPDELIDAKLKARYFFAGYANLRQVLLGMYSLNVHHDAIGAQSDLDAKMRGLWAALFPEIDPIPNSHFSCSFGHLSGYGAAYYSYHYSKAFAVDVLSHIKANGGVLDASIGAQYKDKILGKGGSVEPTEIMRDFLGREPSLDAYWKHIGIE